MWAAKASSCRDLQKRISTPCCCRGAGVGTWAWNVQSGELRINEAWAAIIGYTLDELAPISIEESARTLSVWHDRYRVDHPERGLIWIEGNATPERLPDGGTLWHGFLRDVTEDQIQRQRLMLSDKIVSATQEGVMITDATARILDVNPAFCRITGYSRDEVIGQRTSILKSGRQDADFYRQLW